MKVQQTATGLVFEFQPPDAAERVRQGGYSYVDASAVGVRETLLAMTAGQLKALGAQHTAFRLNAPATSVHGMNQSERDYLVDALIPAIEAGAISLS